MEMIKIAGVGLTALLLILTLTPIRPEFSGFIRIVISVLLATIVISQAIPVLKEIEIVLSKLEIETTWISILVKMLGIAYIAEFSSELCRDAGEGALASKIELGAKVMILVIGMPVFQSLLQMISMGK